MTTTLMSRYYFSMRALEKRQFFAGQAVIRSVLACLIVLQALAFAASPAFAKNAPDGADHTLAPSTIEGDCHALGGDKAPAQGRHDHAQCCVLCSANGRDAAELLTAAILFAVAFCSAPELAISLVRFSNVDFNDHPLGWTSSWSSRAPPQIS